MLSRKRPRIPIMGAEWVAAEAAAVANGFWDNTSPLGLAALQEKTPTWDRRG